MHFGHALAILSHERLRSLDPKRSGSRAASWGKTAHVWLCVCCKRFYLLLTESLFVMLA